MVNRQVSISDAEWTIMKALWQCKDKKMTLKEIAEAVDFVYDYVVSELAKLDCRL